MVGEASVAQRWAQAIAAARVRLADAGVDSPDSNARLLAEFAREAALAHEGSRWADALAEEAAAGAAEDTAQAKAGARAREEMSPAEVEVFERAVAERVERVPLQHIVGTMYFRYLELEAVPGVFIVRPETEMVVEAALDELAAMRGSAYAQIKHAAGTSAEHGDAEIRAEHSADTRIQHAADQPVATAPARETGLEKDGGRPVVVDLCTGSGAIAIAIATEADAAVTAVELSTAAYESARRNNARYGAQVRLVCGDALTELDELAGAVDLVVTNPPYVRRGRDLSPEVLADPALALFGGGEAGLDMPVKLLDRAWVLLRGGGILIMEHGDEQGAAIRQAATQRGYRNVHTGQDLTGRDRWLRAQKPEGEE